MDILIIGGSRFVGYYCVAAAHDGGHRVTMFNRGRSNPNAFPDVEEIHGDRDGELDKLKGRTWDAVIDTCGYVPRVVKASLDALRDAVPTYNFVSTVSVYQESGAAPLDEDSPLATLDDPATEAITGETYGGLKVLCEQAVQAGYPQQHLITRPGLIVGPRDTTNRFGYWIERIAAGGEILAPGAPDDPIQVIDVRDLAAFTVEALEQGTRGVFNLVGPDYRLTMGAFLETCLRVTGADARLTWVPSAFLMDHGVAPWSGLPLWLPPADNGLMKTRNQRAIAAGLRFRPLEETIRDFMAWSRAAGPASAGPAGPLSSTQEADLLAAWHAQGA